MSLREVLLRGAKRCLQLFKSVTQRENEELFCSRARYGGVSRIVLKPALQSPLAKKSADFIGSLGNIWRGGWRETLASRLRRQFGWNFQTGARPGGILLGFVGLTMTSNSGPGLITSHDEFRAICEHIRISLSNVDNIDDDENVARTKTSLENYTIGSVIAKGCNAVVYAAKENRLQPEFGSHLDEIKKERMLLKSELDDIMPNGRFADYPLALKMMFNYDAESNAPIIFRAMYRETLPTKCLTITDRPSLAWEAQRFLKALPHHPNIVDMKCAFADQVPSLPEQQRLYPQALPTRLYADGCGRNMTLFLAMKRYHKSLGEYLETCKPSSRVSIILLSQLLEGVRHLDKNGIVHRDLKSDNILLDLSYGPNMPHLVITDFGCCSVSMAVPFPSIHLDQREGNVALMAPEVACAVPGPFSYIDYGKADLWAVGTLAYEIFGHPNPFYRVGEGKRLDCRTYAEDELPRMTDQVPFAIKALVGNLLQRNPSRRMNVAIAANICHLLVMAPCHWLVEMGKHPTEEDVTRWLLMQHTVATYFHNSSSVFDVMKRLFLRRIQIDEVLDALHFIRSASL